MCGLLSGGFYNYEAQTSPVAHRSRPRVQPQPHLGTPLKFS